MTLANMTWEQDPLHLRAGLQGMGYCLMDRLVPGDKFPVIDGDRQVSDFTAAGKLAYVQALAAYHLADMLRLDPVIRQKLVLAAGFYKPLPWLEKELEASHGFDGLEAYRGMTAPYLMATAGLAHDVAQLSTCSGHTSNRVVINVHSMFMGDVDQLMVLVISWINQRLSNDGLVDGPTRLAKLEATWATRAPMPAVRQCMELSMTSGQFLMQHARPSFRTEADMVAELNHRMREPLAA